jgi:hypothetical protein
MDHPDWSNLFLWKSCEKVQPEQNRRLPGANIKRETPGTMRVCLNADRGLNAEFLIYDKQNKCVMTKWNDIPSAFFQFNNNKKKKKIRHVSPPRPFLSLTHNINVAVKWLTFLPGILEVASSSIVRNTRLLFLTPERKNVGRGSILN